MTLFTTLALAAPLPERPPPVDPIDGECPMAVAIRAGQPISPELIEVRNGVVVAKCSAVAVPLSQQADLLKMETWAIEVHDASRLEVMRLEVERDHWQALAAPAPWIDRPGTQRVIGQLEGVAAVLIGAWAVKEVAR